jgi:aryl-alcohol dehydrogenase-like predicted oxidoreductase
MENWRPATLGRTERTVGRLGLASSYGADDRCVAMAFDSGVNYFYWGTIRRGPFGKGLRQLARARERLVITLQTYSRVALLVPWSVELALRSLRMEYADVLLLGLWNKPVSSGILDQAQKLRERGLVRHLGLSTHNRAMAGRMAAAGAPEVLHVRYNAIHRGAEEEIFPALPACEERPGIVSIPAKLERGERVPTAADCYRFVMSNPAVDVCMAGPKNAAEFQAGLEALRRGPMDADELDWMRRVGRAKYGKRS